MAKNDNAQANIDFLSGISIFLIAFLVIVQIVPNIFIPFQGHPVSLHSVAYRTGVILVEDPGWYNGTINFSGDFVNSSGYNWEAHPDNLSRIGLAKNKFSSDFANPLTISVPKVTTLAGLYNSSDPDSYIYIQQKLGLITSYRGYDYNISLVRLDDEPSMYINKTPILSIGKIPHSGIDIEKIERIVYFDVFDEEAGPFYIDGRIDNQSTDSSPEVINIPISAFRIVIESRNVNLNKPWIQVDVTNQSGPHTLVNKTNYSDSELPVELELAEDLIKFDDDDHEITIDIQYNNTFGYYYYSQAGTVAGDKLAGKIVIKVW